MRVLKFPAHNFDRTTTFEVVVGKSICRCTLERDYQKPSDGILWAHNAGVTLKSHYGKDDIIENDRLSKETPLRHGDNVIVEGREHVVRVLGPFSDCAIFDPL